MRTRNCSGSWNTSCGQAGWCASIWIHENHGLVLNLATLSLDAMMAKDGLRAVLCSVRVTWAGKPWKPSSSVKSRSPWWPNPERARDRFGSDGANVDFIDFGAWTNNPPVTPLIVSTMRVASPMYGTKQRLPTTEPLTVMDFSWPPSIDAEGLHPSKASRA